MFLAASEAAPLQPLPDAPLREAAALIHAGEADEAERVLERFLSSRPGDGRALHRAGVLWLLGGDPARSVSYLRAAVRAAPDLVDARLALGQALGQLERFEEALVHLDRAAGDAPGRHEASYLAAAVLDRAGRLSEAVESAGAATRIAPRNPELRRFLGRLLLRIEHWREAQGELEAALRLGYREDPAIFQDLGAALIGQERLALARAAYERHLELVPDDPETLLQLGYLDWRRGDHHASEERLRKAISLDPDLRRAHHFLGLTALRRFDLAGAEAAFRRALAEGEDFPEAWFHLGKIALRRGDPEQAAGLLETALRYAPEYAEAYYQLAFARRRLGDSEGAAEALARFEALRGDQAGRPEESP